MIFISHRGNLYKKNIDTENTIYQINKSLDYGFDVEIDVWYLEKKFWLGHDKPCEHVTESFLQQNKLWCHAKNYDALFVMTKNELIHCFWHNTDTYTLTSKGIIWAFPGSILNERSICVLPENNNFKDYLNCYGICSDNIIKYSDEYRSN